MPLFAPKSISRWLLVVALLVIGACSSTSFFYSRLDFFLPWYIERFVDLDREQSQILEQQLEPVLTWHRYEELPVYVAFLSEVEGALDKPLTAVQVEGFVNEIEDSWIRVRDRGLEELILIGETLSEEQIDEFFAELDKRQKKLEKKYLKRSDEEFHDDVFDELKGSFKDYLGRLSRDQKDRLLTAANGLERSDHHWLNERAQWIAQMRTELRREPGWQDSVRLMIRDWEDGIDPAAQAVYDQNNHLVRQVIADVANMRSDKQDSRLRKELSKLRDELRELSQTER